MRVCPHLPQIISAVRLLVKSRSLLSDGVLAKSINSEQNPNTEIVTVDLTRGSAASTPWGRDADKAASAPSPEPDAGLSDA
jgi:hypothetical protein